MHQKQTKNTIAELSRKKRLELNSKTTEVMVISTKQIVAESNIFINETKLKLRDLLKSAEP